MQPEKGSTNIRKHISKVNIQLCILNSNTTQKKYLICCNNELNRFGIKLRMDITGSQGIYPGKFPVLRSSLVKLLENLDTFDLKPLENIYINTQFT
jgi:hypothetical protein